MSLVHRYGGLVSRRNVKSAIDAGKWVANKYNTWKSQPKKPKRNNVGSRSSLGVTGRYNQFTNKRVGKKRKFSRGEKRFYKKVKKIVDGDDATQHALRNPYITAGLSMAISINKQATYGISLGGMNGDAGTEDDIKIMFNSFAAGITDESWIELGGGVCTYTISNPTGNVALDMDIYDMICIKDLPLALTATNPISFFNNSVAAQGTTGVGGTQLLFDTPGVNPYIVPVFGQYFKIKSRKKVFLPAGDQMDSSFSMKWNKRIQGREIGATSGLLAKKGVTRFLLFIVNGVDWSGMATAPKLFGFKKYTYQAVGQKTFGAGLV